MWAVVSISSYYENQLGLIQNRFEYIKGVIRSLKSKDRQYNNQNEKDKLIYITHR